MNFIEAAVFIIFIATISVPLANRLRLPLEIFLVIGSCMISLIPGLPSVQLNPMIVFEIFLPPILFSGAYFMPWRDFKFNIRPISLLAFGLVLFTMLVVAALAKIIIPAFNWAECFLLGAIVSPTDASAATAIIRKLGAPRRIIVLLEGESLINDATALILYKFSLAAVIYGSFSWTDAMGDFTLMAIGGVVVGFSVGYAAKFVLRYLDNISAETSFTFLIAFISYLGAEHLGFSGVIATVVCGIYFGIHFPEVAPYQTRFNTKASWQTLLFIINSFVFMLIGFQLPTVLKNLSQYSAADLAFYGSMVSLCVIVLRLIWVYPAAYLPRIFMPSINKQDPMPAWRFLFTLGWTGMRGIVSLAAVLAIPHHLPDGTPFPGLDLLIYLTYCVVVTTLLLPSLTLPTILHGLHLDEMENKLKEEAICRIHTIETVLKHITQVAKNENIPSDVLIEFNKQLERKLKAIKTQLQDTPYSVLSDEYIAIKKLTRLALQKERKTLIKLRQTGEIHEEVFRVLSDELDIEEIRAKSWRV